MTEAPNQFTVKLIAELERCAKAFCEKNACLAYESKTTYRSKPETSDNIQSFDIDVFYNNHIIRFMYYPHMPLSMSHSVLTCSVSFDKGRTDKVFYPLSQLFGYMKSIPANALAIPIILTADSMRESFEFLASAIQELYPFIERMSFDEDIKVDFFNSEVKSTVALFKKAFPSDDSIREFFGQANEELYPGWKADQEQGNERVDDAKIREDFERMLLRLQDQLHSSIDEDKRKLLRLHYHQLTTQSIHPAYEAYMVGNYAVAIKKLKKFKSRTAYDDCLVEYMEKSRSAHPHVPASVYSNLSELFKNGMPKSRVKEGLLIAPAMLLFGLPWLPLFLGAYFLFYYFENRDAVYLLGVLGNAPSAMLPALLLGITMIYFHSKTFYKLFFRKNYQKLMELESAIYSRTTHRFMQALTAFLIIGSMIFLFLTVHQNIKMTQNGFYDNAEFWSIQGKFYQYSEVDRLRYRENTPSGYGDSFPIPSYVILLKNGKVIDPIRLETNDPKFIDVFRSKNVLIEGR